MSVSVSASYLPDVAISAARDLPCSCSRKIPRSTIKPCRPLIPTLSFDFNPVRPLITTSINLCSPHRIFLQAYKWTTHIKHSRSDHHIRRLLHRRRPRLRHPSFKVVPVHYTRRRTHFRRPNLTPCRLDPLRPCPRPPPAHITAPTLDQYRPKLQV